MAAFRDNTATKQMQPRAGVAELAFIVVCQGPTTCLTLSKARALPPAACKEHPLGLHGAHTVKHVHKSLQDWSLNGQTQCAGKLES